MNKLQCVNTMAVPGSREALHGISSSPSVGFNTPDYLCWRRLFLCKSKLDNVAEMASFMAGFAMAALIELQINDEDVNPPLLTAYVITTACQVGCCVLAVMIATCVLPHLQAVVKTARISPPMLSPHDDMLKLIDLSWVLTTSAALFFFVLNTILMCWIKFTLFSRAASIAATVIMSPLLVAIPILGFIFSRRVSKNQGEISNMMYEKVGTLCKYERNCTHC